MQDNEIKDNWRGAGAKRGEMSEPSHDWFQFYSSDWLIKCREIFQPIRKCSNAGQSKQGSLSDVERVPSAGG